VKVVRGVDNLAIESDCTWVQPDLKELKRVSGKHPVLGGSHYGLVDMTGGTTDAEQVSSSLSYSDFSRSQSLLLASTPVLSNFSSTYSAWLLFSTLCLLLCAVIAVMWIRTGGNKMSHAVWSQSSAEYVSLP